ncbi:MAG: hypothetical protein K2X47_18455 [Bdellovibrionales bacterium]|nr:hypothetical protein [Bdellovibrionales bacterium]
MKKTLLIASLLVLFCELVTAATLSNAVVGRVRGYGVHTVLVETPNGRMITVPKSSLSRKAKLKMGGKVTLVTSARSSKARRRSS